MSALDLNICLNSSNKLNHFAWAIFELPSNISTMISTQYTECRLSSSLKKGRLPFKSLIVVLIDYNLCVLNFFHPDFFQARKFKKGTLAYFCC